MKKQAALIVKYFAGDIRKIRKLGGVALRDYRVSLGYSQREFAKMLGVTNVHLCEVENGRNDPTNMLIAADKLKL